MTGGPEGSGTRAPFVHRALLYRGEHDLVPEATRFIREALARGGLALAVVSAPKARLLQEALGPEAHRVEFGDAGEWFARPGSLVQRFARYLGARSGNGRLPRRVVAEHPAPDRRAREWARYESMMNVSLAPFEAGLLCPYDSSRTSASMIADVRRTHPELVEAGAWARSREFTDPLAFMRQSDRDLQLAAAPADAPAYRLGSAAALFGLRRFVRGHAATAGLGEGALDDLQLAASEIASNVIVHTPGPGEARVWTEGGDFVCEVSDSGPGIGDPFAGYRLPMQDAGSGRGLWLARQLCDEVRVGSRAGSTVVRLHLELEEAGGPLPR